MRSHSDHYQQRPPQFHVIAPSTIHQTAIAPNTSQISDRLPQLHTQRSPPQIYTQSIALTTHTNRSPLTISLTHQRSPLIHSPTAIAPHPLTNSDRPQNPTTIQRSPPTTPHSDRPSLLHQPAIAPTTPPTSDRHPNSTGSDRT